MNKIALISCGRSDYNIYLPLIKKLNSNPTIKLDIIAAGTHSMPEYGNTIDLFAKDNLTVTHIIDTISNDDSSQGIVKSMADTMSDFSKFCEMLVNNGVHNNKRIISEENIKTMTSKYSNGYPDPSEPNVFPLEGYSYGFTFSVLEDSDAWASGAPSGIYGWSGYHNTWFWIDPTNNLYALFMSNSIEPDFSILKDFQIATYKFIN